MDKYEKALELARNYYPSNLFLDTIFPELAESEDEKTRKRVIECLKLSLKGAEDQNDAGSDRTCDIEALKWGIAYLEKQKERQPVPALDRGDEIILKAICEELQNAPGWVERIKGWYSLAKDAQQPAEWSAEDEKNLVSILWHVSYSVSNGKQTDCHCDLTDWLKALPERIKSIRPQPQWKPTEEQMAILDKVYHYLWADRNATADMQDGLGDLIEVLKKL